MAQIARIAPIRLRRQLLPYAFVLPLAALLLIVNFYPMFYSFRLSLSSWPIERMFEGPQLTGFGNFAKMASDPRLRGATGFMVFFVVAAVALEFLLGLLVALLLDSKLPARGVIRSLIILPMAIAPLVASIVWRFLLNADYGIVNYGLRAVGLAPIGWLSTLPAARWSIVLVEVWHNMPFVALILLAGLQAVPNELVEASRIDGAGRWQSFRYVTLPMLRSAILVALLIRTTNAVRMFDASYALTGGGPFSSTETYSFVAYMNAFQGFDLPYAAAVSWLVFLLNLIVSLAFVRLLLVKARA